jgi:hypothetical protein
MAAREPIRVDGADTTKLEDGVPASEKLPPRGTDRHLFHSYAIDSEIPLPPGVKRDQIDEAIRQHIVDECQLDGKYTHHRASSMATSGVPGVQVAFK